MVKNRRGQVRPPCRRHPRWSQLSPRFALLYYDSFAFEIAPHGASGLYNRLVAGYEALISDGNAIEELDISFPGAGKE